MADPARDVGLKGGLGEGEEVCAEAGLALLAEEGLDEVVERALEVAQGDALADHEALDLVELRQVGRVGHIAAVDLARADHVDGRLFLLHGVHLGARGLGAQQDVGLAAHVGDVAAAVEDVEGVLHRAAGVVGRRVERGEVVEVGLDLAAGDDLVADAGEDVAHLADDVVDEVLRADGHAAPGQGDVNGAGGHLLFELGGLELLLLGLERRLDGVADLVGHLADDGALLLGELAHAAQGGGEAALLAQDGDADLLEGVAALGILDLGKGVVPQLLELFLETHVSPSRQRGAPVQARAQARL